MEIQEVKDQAKNWIDSRMKNPYFGAVIIAWLFANRILVFSIFNFDSSYLLIDRISFIQNELKNFDKLSFIGLHGFCATVIWSLLFGYVLMVLFDQLNGLGKVIFKFGNKSTKWLLQKVEPENWKPIEEFKLLEQQRDQLDNDNISKRIEIKELQKSVDELENSLLETKKDYIEKDKLSSELLESNKILHEQIRQQTDVNNKFKILYARYGTDEKYIEVTKVVTELLSVKDSFIANNDNLKYDPLPNTIKKLFIHYQLNSNEYKVEIYEDEMVRLQDNVIKKSETDKSIELKKWLSNIHKLSEILNGQWQLQVTSDSLHKTYTINLNSDGDFYVDGKYEFDILVPEFNNNIISLNKYSTQCKTPFSNEKLRIVDNNLLKGNDSNGNKVQYLRLDNDSII